MTYSCHIIVVYYYLIHNANLPAARNRIYPVGAKIRDRQRTV